MAHCRDTWAAGRGTIIPAAQRALLCAAQPSCGVAGPADARLGTVRYRIYNRIARCKAGIIDSLPGILANGARNGHQIFSTNLSAIIAPSSDGTRPRSVGPCETGRTVEDRVPGLLLLPGSLTAHGCLAGLALMCWELPLLVL